MIHIEDYALIGDLETAALVGKSGSIDWLCLPRFDSPACFAALLGDEENGRWLIAPVSFQRVSRRYLEDSLVLETRFESETGVVTVIDCMPVRQSLGDRASLIRLVRGESGRVRMKMELTIRFDYGATVPWFLRRDFGLTAMSGPNAIDLSSPVPLEGKDFRTYADFDVSAGEVIPFSLDFRNSMEKPEPTLSPRELVEETSRWWTTWSSATNFTGPYRPAVVRSLITLKALIHASTGGVLAAPTTSLPEVIGGSRNWDYRFCWLRDATFTLYALLTSGFSEEAGAWRNWLLRAAAGKPSQLQAVYGLAGERMLTEIELSSLRGFQSSQPVRIGNLAHQQLQLDVYGEILDVFHVSRCAGMAESEESWALERALVEHLESAWREPDNGIWEVRGPRRQFTHSKVLAWVAFDRAVKAIERFGLPGPLDRWKRLRAEIHAEICHRAYNPTKGSFVQCFDGETLDGALLLIPLVGFLPASDPRVQSTVRAIERELTHEGYIRRYLTDAALDGQAGQEGAFLPCTFWLVDNYVLMGRLAEAHDLFSRLLSIRNDVGLLAEEYDAETGFLGNFPQAFSHVSLINTAHNLQQTGPAAHRSKG